MIRIYGFFQPRLQYIPDEIDELVSIENMTPEMLYMIHRNNGYHFIVAMALQHVRDTLMPNEHFDDRFSSVIDAIEAKIRSVLQPLR